MYALQRKNIHFYVRNICLLLSKLINKIIIFCMFVLFFIQNSKTHIIECAYFAFVRTVFKIYADLLYHGFTIRKRVKLLCLLYS